MNEYLSEYLSTGFKKINGACNANLFKALVGINIIQQSAEIHGGVAEIGVRFGKSFIGLNNLKNQGEASVAIDLFEDQHLNVNKSGWRPKEEVGQFFENIKEYAAFPEEIDALKADSIDLTSVDACDFVKNFGKIRLFSIDGAHNSEHTFSDMNFARSVLSPGGVVFIDDYYNQDFPGVHEGVAAFMHSSRTLCPFLFFSGRLFLSTFSYHKIYFNRIKAYFQNAHKKCKITDIVMYGYDALSIRNA